MIKKVLLWVACLTFITNSFSVALADGGSDCGDGAIKLNTDVPFVGNCISTEDEGGSSWETNVSNAFPKLMWWVAKIVITLVLVIALLMVILWWVMITAWWMNQWLVAKWKSLILKVVIAIALLGLSWAILHLINPNFFKI